MQRKILVAEEEKHERENASVATVQHEAGSRGIRASSGLRRAAVRAVQAAYRVRGRGNVREMLMQGWPLLLAPRVISVEPMRRPDSTGRSTQSKMTESEDRSGG